MVQTIQPEWGLRKRSPEQVAVWRGGKEKQVKQETKSWTQSMYPGSRLTTAHKNDHNSETGDCMNTALYRPTKYMHRLEFHRHCKLCQLVVNLGVELRECGVNDAKTHESDIRLYLFMSKVHLLVSQMNNLIQSKCTEYTEWSNRLCAPDDYSTKIPTKLMIWRWPSQNIFRMWTMLYRTRSSRTQFGMPINVLRLVGDTLNIVCNFLYCYHQVHRDFLITLYNVKIWQWLSKLIPYYFADKLIQPQMNWKIIILHPAVANPRDLPEVWVMELSSQRSPNCALTWDEYGYPLRSVL